MKTNLPPETSWGQALDLMRQGKFPMDLAGMNPAGWLQMGTLLSKANLLQDETARLLGLTAEAVPDDAFRAIKGLIEQSTQEAERLAAFSAATIDAVAMETTKAGDIVDIKSGKASHSFTFGGGTRNKVFDIAAQAYPESFTMLSENRAVRVKGSTVYLYNVTDSQFTQIASQTLNGGRSLGGTPVKISDTEFFCIGKDWFEDSESDNGGYYVTLQSGAGGALRLGTNNGSGLVPIKNVGAPTANTDAANKEYVDGSQRIFYGTCSTAGSTVEKAINVTGFPGLVEGVALAVRFIYACNSSYVTLNVNGLGAKRAFCGGDGNPPLGAWESYSVVMFIFSNNCWYMVPGSIASTGNYGMVKLTSSLESASTVLAASASAVRKVANCLPKVYTYTGSGNSKNVYLSEANDLSTPLGALICDSRGYALGVSNNGFTSSLPGGFVPWNGKLTNPNSSSVYIEFGDKPRSGSTNLFETLYLSSANAANVQGITYYVIVFCKAN